MTREVYNIVLFAMLIISFYEWNTFLKFFRDILNKQISHNINLMM